MPRERARGVLMSASYRATRFTSAAKLRETRFFLVCFPAVKSLYQSKSVIDPIRISWQVSKRGSSIGNFHSFATRPRNMKSGSAVRVRDRQPSLPDWALALLTVSWRHTHTETDSRPALQGKAAHALSFNNQPFKRGMGLAHGVDPRRHHCLPDHHSRAS